ncbi:MAG: hypothetical protein AB7L36_15805, partial [Sphingomonadaceae bacterium]
PEIAIRERRIRYDQHERHRRAKMIPRAGSVLRKVQPSRSDTAERVSINTRNAQTIEPESLDIVLHPRND